MKLSLHFQYLSFNDRIEPKFKEMINFFILNDINNNIDKIEIRTPELKTLLEEEEEEEKKKNELNEKDENSQYTKPLKIKIDISLDFFLKDKIGIENENSKLKIKLDEIEIKKDLLLDKYNDYVSKGWKQLFDVYDKFDNEKQETNMDIFYSIEKKLINDITKDF